MTPRKYRILTICFVLIVALMLMACQYSTLGMSQSELIEWAAEAVPAP